MKQRITILCITALLVAVIAIFPRAKKVEKIIEATEYSFADPSYAVTHTITINGYDTRNFIGRGQYQGIFAVEGWETAQEDWKLSARFPIPYNYGNAIAVKPSGEPLSTDILSLLPNRNWTSFVAVIQTIEDKGDHRYGSFDPNANSFIVCGTLSREEAFAEACRLTKGTSLQSLFANQ